MPIEYYTPEFKAKVVAEARKHEKTYEQIGIEYGRENPIPPTTICRWVKKEEEKEALAQGFPLPEKQQRKGTPSRLERKWEAERRSWERERQQFCANHQESQEEISRLRSEVDSLRNTVLILSRVSAPANKEAPESTKPRTLFAFWRRPQA